MGLRLRLLDGAYTVARLDALARIPDWADGPGFVSISRTDDELSVICLSDRVPADIQQDGEWACLKLLGPFAFDQSGIMMAVIRPLSQAGMGVLVVASFDTDHLLVKPAHLAAARGLLAEAGHAVD